MDQQLHFAKRTVAVYAVFPVDATLEHMLLEMQVKADEVAAREFGVATVSNLHHVRIVREVKAGFYEHQFEGDTLEKIDAPMSEI